MQEGGGLGSVRVSGRRQWRPPPPEQDRNIAPALHGRHRRFGSDRCCNYRRLGLAPGRRSRCRPPSQTGWRSIAPAPAARSVGDRSRCRSATKARIDIGAHWVCANCRILRIDRGAPADAAVAER
jgi:hypothetical protein